MTIRPQRPWRRSMLKLLVEWTHGRKRRHAHAWLPSLVLMPAEAAPDRRLVHYRGRTVVELLPASALVERAGETIHIIGSGPSIAQNDLSRIGPGQAILLNGAISLIGNPIAEPLAVAIEDERFVWRHFALMAERIGQGTLCLFSVSVIRALCDIDPGFLVGRQVVLIDDIVKPYDHDRRSRDDLKALPFALLSTSGAAGLSLDPDRGVFPAGSVAVSALQFAIHAKPRTIGLFGIDISNAAQPRFYEKRGDVAKSGIVRAQARILAHMALARSICEDRGIVLRNFSEVSALRTIGLAYDAAFEKRPDGLASV